MPSEEAAYLNLCLAVWEAGWQLWWDRWTIYSGIAPQMAIIVSAPDAFFDAEPWEFALQINEPDGSGALDLTGSRLFVRFASLADGAEVGTCDSNAANASLVITSGPDGNAVFSLSSQGRTWRAPRTFPAALAQPTTVVGDLYRRPPGTTKWQPIGRITFPVLPSTGLPTP